MADPDPYVISYDFSAYQASNPAQPLPGHELDSQLQDIATSTVQLTNAIKDIRRADGKLQNGLVGMEALDPIVASGVSEGANAADAIAAAAVAVAARDQAVAAAAAAEASADDAEAAAGANATTIVFTPTGNLSSTNVATALAELDTEKSSTSHVHAASVITTAAITGLAGASNVQAVLEALLPLLPQTGDVVLTFDDTAPAGWMMIDDTSIGDASSSAVHKGDDYKALYIKLYLKVGNTYAPVSGGRSGNTQTDALNDWNAHKTMTLPKQLGRALAVAGLISPAQSSFTYPNGFVYGQELVTLTAAQNGPHRHTLVFTDPGHVHGNGSEPTGSDTIGAGYITRASQSPTGVVANTQNNTTGAYVHDGVGNVNMTSLEGGSPHENRQPTVWLNARIKL